LHHDFHRTPTGDDRLHRTRSRHKMTLALDLCSCTGYPLCSDIKGLFPGVIFDCTYTEVKEKAREARVRVTALDEDEQENKVHVRQNTDTHTWRKCGAKPNGTSYYRCVRCSIRRKTWRKKNTFKPVHTGSYRPGEPPCCRD
jgi:hypothetical protein